MSKSREQLVKYLNKVSIQGKRVLDAGCGPREKHILNFTTGVPKQYVCCDISGDCAPTYIIDLNKYTVTDWKPFDVIFCLETLEHLYAPYTALDWLFRHLKKGGRIYFSTPFINPYHDEVDYARYTSEWYETILTKVGFRDVRVKARVATAGLPHLLNFYAAEGLRMSKIRLKKGERYKMAEIGYFVSARK